MALQAKPETRRKRGYACDGCAGCCREMIVPVNDSDVLRLAKISGLSSHRIVGFYGTRHVEYDGESPLWVRTRYGMRIMAMKRIGNKCRFLTGAGRCRFYRQRPSTCRTFPYEIRVRDSARRILVDCTDWPSCRAKAALVDDWRDVLRARYREIREDKRFCRRLRAWESASNGRTSDLKVFLFGMSDA